MTTTADLQVTPVIADTVITAVQNSSAFMKVSKKANIPGGGLKIPVLGTSDAAWVDEAAPKKVANAPLSTLTLEGKKIAKIVYISTELKNDHAAVAEAIQTELQGSVGVTIDKTIAGLIQAPSGVDSLGAATTQQVTDWKSFYAAIAASDVYTSTAAVMTNALLNQLAQVEDNFGRPLFAITRTSNESGTIGVAGGVTIPFELFSGTSARIGFVGPFATRAWAGVVPGSVALKYSEEATLDDNGTLVHLWQNNLVAYLVEARVAFKVVDVAEFRKLTAGAAS